MLILSIMVAFVSGLCGLALLAYLSSRWSKLTPHLRIKNAVEAASFIAVAVLAIYLGGGF